MRIVMMGTGPFAVPTYEWLTGSEHEIAAVITRPQPPARSRRKTPPNPMRVAAEKHGATLLEPASINSDEAYAALEQLAADLFVVCDYGQILSRKALGLAKYGGVNLHGSLLPAYRGAAPVNWAIYNGDERTGVTVIHMTPRLDGGPCICVRETPIDPHEDAVQLEKRLSLLGVEAMQEAMQILQRSPDDPPGETQDPAKVTQAPRLSKADGAINWQRTAQQIYDQLRAFQPWPGVYTHYLPKGGKPMRLIIEQMQPDPQGGAGTEPGQVVSSDGQQLEIATGEGSIRVQQVQPAGKRSMPVADFLRGHPMMPGAQFGDL